MVEKRDVRSFFDRLAPGWDAETVRNEPVIARILDNAGVREGCTVLDVACGTGVLFGDYVRRGAAQVTAIDLSPEMAARAAAKAGGSPVTVLCGEGCRAPEGRTLYLTGDCGRYQRWAWTAPRGEGAAVAVTEELAGVLLEAGKWEASDIHIISLLDIRGENHYNAT